jgi:hypothetical protein
MPVSIDQTWHQYPATSSGHFRAGLGVDWRSRDALDDVPFDEYLGGRREGRARAVEIANVLE